MKPEDIKAIRVALGLTQEAFAGKLRIDFATVNLWGNGHKKPSVLALKVLERLKRRAQRA